MWWKWTICLYSGEDLCKGKFQFLLYSTWVALPIDGCHKGLILHLSYNHVTVAILVTNAIDKITNHSLQWKFSHNKTFVWKAFALKHFRSCIKQRIFYIQVKCWRVKESQTTPRIDTLLLLKGRHYFWTLAHCISPVWVLHCCLSPLALFGPPYLLEL